MQNETVPELDGPAFRNVVGHFTSGVTIVTAEHDDTLFGATVSAVSSLSADPPMMLVCLHQRSAPTPRSWAQAGSPSTSSARARTRWR